jgi:hypothetical protein
VSLHRNSDVKPARYALAVWVTGDDERKPSRPRALARDDVAAALQTADISEEEA